MVITDPQIHRWVAGLDGVMGRGVSRRLARRQGA